MSYTHTTRSALRALLASRLGDPNSVHWLTAELNLYIADTLSKWNLLTGSRRARAQFTTSAGVAIYNLASQDSFTSLIADTRTDRTEMGLMQYLLREPYEPLAGAGMSDQFTFVSLVSALQRARDRLIADTSVTLALAAPASVSAGSPYLTLPDSAIAIRRAVWLSLDAAYSNLHLSDEHEAFSYETLYAQRGGPPELISQIASPQLSWRLLPTPSDNGTVEAIVVEAGAPLAPATPVALGIPDDTTWVARSLALADLLGRDGPAYDPSRASFCLDEYRLGVQLASISPLILAAEIDGVPVIPSSIAELDLAYSSPHWQSGPTGTPLDLGVLGGFVALRPVPDGPHSIMLDLVAKASQPAADDSPIEVGREDINAILDGSEALALFKLGGSYIDDSKRLSQQMFTAALRYNSRLSTLGYGNTMSRIARTDTDSRPEFGSGHGTGTIGAGAGAGAGAEGMKEQR